MSLFLITLFQLLTLGIDGRFASNVVATAFAEQEVYGDSGGRLLGIPLVLFQGEATEHHKLGCLDFLGAVLLTDDGRGLMMPRRGRNRLQSHQRAK